MAKLFSLFTLFLITVAICVVHGEGMAVDGESISPHND
jgi:hypothetical protein